jgi:hypothetical protein
MTVAEDAAEALRLAREALALAEAAARAAGVEVAPFDSYEQDQAISVIHTDVDGVRTSAIEFVDRPTSSLVGALLAGQVDGRVDGHAGEDPEEAPVRRMRLAKEADGSVGLTFRDQQGRERLRLGLDAHGHPSLELLGPSGGPAGGIG